MNRNVANIIHEIEKVVVGKQSVIEKILTTIIANGHILLDDVPGIGKTTIAVALSRSLGLTFGRIQFTPDVLPSDITGFTMYNKEQDAFIYKPGIAVGVNMLLGDEINRTSSKTQSALLEAMEEGQVTVDGASHVLKTPFIVIATQNNVGTAGTQLLPYAQLDRFLMKLTIGYPDRQHEMDVIRGRQTMNPMDNVICVSSVENVVQMQEDAKHMIVKDSIIDYITRLAETSRNHELLALGISPRGSLFVNKTAKARAYVKGRDYVLPEDVQAVFVDVCAHRVVCRQQAVMQKVTVQQILNDLLKDTHVPDTMV